MLVIKLYIGHILFFPWDMVTDLDLESQVLGFRVRGRGRKKGRLNWKRSKRRTNCTQRNSYSIVEMVGMGNIVARGKGIYIFLHV